MDAIAQAFSVEEGATTTVICWCGKSVTEADSLEFKEMFLEKGKLPQTHVILDFSIVEYIDDSFRGKLSMLNVHLGQSGKKLIIVSRRSLNVLFRMSNVHHIYVVKPTLLEALEAL